MIKQWMVAGQLWSGEMIEGSGVPIVILHGWGRSQAEWSPICNHLAKVTGRAVYCLDLPGFGGSNLPKVSSMEEYAELVVKWMEYVGIKQGSLVGHSLGGRVGIILGAKYGAKIEKLVLIDPAGVRPRSLKRAALKGMAKLMAWVPVGVRRRVVERVMDEDYRNSPALRELYRAVVKSDLRKYLPQIKLPTWVIWGERDPLLPLALTRVYKKLLSSPTIRVVWEAGHDPHLTHSRELTRILEEVWT